MGFDWKDLIRSVAPVLGAALGGPLGSTALSTVATALLGPGEHTEEQVVQALAKATPEQLLALKKADQDFAVAMRRLDIDAESIEERGRHSARQLAAADSEHVAARLTYFVAGAFAATLLCVGILAYAQPNASPSPYIAGLVGTVVGAVISEFKQMTAFHFGKNSSSARTQEMLYQSTPKDGK